MQTKGLYSPENIQWHATWNAQPQTMNRLYGLDSLGNNGNSMFFYMGNVIGLESALEKAQNSPRIITDVNITVTGNQIKEPSMCCYLTTLIVGSILIIPLFFMCCPWWQKIVNAAYTVPLSTYQKMESVFANQSIRSFSLTVCDSTLDKKKADYLYAMLSRSSIKGFTLTNIAPPNNFKSNEWSDFRENFKPIKSLPIMSQIKWHTRVAL